MIILMNWYQRLTWISKSSFSVNGFIQAMLSCIKLNGGRLSDFFIHFSFNAFIVNIIRVNRVPVIFEIFNIVIARLSNFILGNKPGLMTCSYLYMKSELFKIKNAGLWTVPLWVFILLDSFSFLILVDIGNFATSLLMWGSRVLW